MSSPVVKTLKLEEPIQFGTETITELVIRKPKAGDMRRFPAVPDMGNQLDLLGALARQPKAVIDELCIPDMVAANEIIQDFMQRGPGTGSES